MKFKDRSAVLILMGVVLSALLAMPVPALSDDQDRIRSWRDGGDHLDDPMIQLRLRGQIIDDTGLTESELEIYQPLIVEALSLNGGDAEQIREMFRKAVGDECVGDCLMERLRKWNRIMKQEQKQLDGDDQVAELEDKKDQTADQNQTRTRDDADCDPVGDANKNRYGGEAVDQTGDDQTGDQNQTRTRDDADCEPVGDANKNRKGG